MRPQYKFPRMINELDTDRVTNDRNRIVRPGHQTILLMSRVLVG